MSYRRGLLLRWSARDRLAVLVIAVTVAFLVGTSLLVIAAGDQTAAIASEQTSPGIADRYASVAEARANAPAGATILPTAAVTEPDGTEATVVARTNAGYRFENLTERRLYGRNRGVTLGTLDGDTRLELAGEQRAEALQVTPRGRTVLAPEWYVAPRQTVQTLGVTGAIVLDPSETPAPPTGVPLQGTLAFFLLGTRETLRVLSVAAVGAGLLIGVTVYSSTRMTILDRIDAIRVIRATGGQPRSLLSLFGFRGALIAGVGTALGYAVGVILPNAAVNVAVSLGLPTSLALEMTPHAALIVTGLGLGTVGVGAVAGLIAAWPTVRNSVASLGEEQGTPNRDRNWLWPRLLSAQTLVPTTATLTAFVIFAVLVAGMAGAITPLTTTDGATVTEPDAVHPIASDVPEGYATALRARGIDASPEILGFVAVDGRPFVVRGVNATAFAQVTDARLTAGRYPDGNGDAIIGADLARTLEVSVGEQVFLGGSTQSALTEVSIVGTVAAAGAFDDQLLVTLPTARHLSGRDEGRVQFIRTTGLPDVTAESNDTEPGESVHVADVTGPTRAIANDSVEVDVRVANDGLGRATHTVEVRFDGETRTRAVTLRAGERSTVSVSLPTGAPGTYALAVNGETRPVEVVSADAIELGGLPTAAPPDSSPLVRVTRLGGAPVENATVRAGTRRVSTNTDGVAAVPLGEPGEWTVRAQYGARTTSASIDVVEGVSRDPVVDVRVEPTVPDVLTRPTAHLTVRNPWNETLAWDLQLAGAERRTATLDAGEVTTVRATLSRQPPGSYRVSVRIDGRAVATTTYDVTGDDRIASAIASGGRRGQSGIGQSARVAFGNLELVLAVVVVLAGLMSVGATTVTFARAVQGRRRTIGIYRATGASPRRVMRMVLGDAVRIAIPATLVSLGAGIAVLAAFQAAGVLSPFGVRLSAVPRPAVALVIVIGALAVALLGAAIATLGFLRETPAALLADERGGDTAGSVGSPRTER